MIKRNVSSKSNNITHSHSIKEFLETGSGKISPPDYIIVRTLNEKVNHCEFTVTERTLWLILFVE